MDLGGERKRHCTLPLQATSRLLIGNVFLPGDSAPSAFEVLSETGKAIVRCLSLFGLVGGKEDRADVADVNGAATEVRVPSLRADAVVSWPEKSAAATLPHAKKR